MRYFMIDRITELVPGQRACGIKNVTLSDEILHDHFPGIPIMPGTLILEAAAQLAGFLLEVGHHAKTDDRGRVRRALLIQVDRAKFRDRAGPGDQLLVEATITSRLETAAQVRAEVTAGERRIATTELTFALKCVDEEAVHEQRRRLYRLWTRDLALDLPIL